MSGCFGNSIEDRAAERRLDRHLESLLDADQVYLLRLRHAEEVRASFSLQDMVDSIQEHAGASFYQAVKDGDACEIGSAALRAIEDFSIACSKLQKSDGELIADADEDHREWERD